MTKKKKRVIKVPKAVNGLESVGSSLQNGLSSNWQANMTNQLFANQIGGIRNDLANLASMMQLRADIATGNPLGATNFNNGTNINQFNTTPSRGGMGLSKAVGALQAAPEAIALLASPFQTSDASTGKEATMQSIEGVAKGIGTGASIGMNFGPMGAVIGGAAGALTGLIGKKGREASMTSFTDYDEGTLGTGLRGAFRNKKLRRRRRQVKMNALNNRAAVAGTEYLQNEYAEDNAGADINSFAQGGNIPSSLAYVDDGELISTPDGSISKVPEEGKPVDQNLVSLPEGSRVLSNTLKVPGTKKTFAQLGEEMMTKKKSKFNDIYAQNAAKLNEMNNKMIHDMLFEQQEALKAKKGIGKEYKNLTEEFQTGGEKRISQNIQYYPYGPEIIKFSGWNSSINNYDPRYLQFVNSLTEDQIRNIAAGQLGSMQRYNSRNKGYIPTLSEARKLMTDKKYGDWHKWVEPLYQQWLNTPSLVEPLDLVDDTVPEVQHTAITRAPITPKTTNKQNNNDEDRPGVDWLGVASGLAGLAPIMSNLFTSDPEKVRANYNPYTRAISNAMSRRRFDINPYIQDITRDRAISDYNASQTNTNTGASMAYRLQSAIARNNAIANIRSMQNNADNQYRAEYANMMNNLGQQFVQANNIADEANAQNRAAARNIRRSGLSQLSQWFQNRELMRNQRDRDNAMLELYGPLLDNFTTDVRNRFNRTIRRRR